MHLELQAVALGLAGLAAGYVLLNFWKIVYWLILGWRRSERMKRLGFGIAMCYTTSRWPDNNKLLTRFKEMNMTEQDIKNVMYGSIRELTQNRNYFYKGYHSHWTEQGKKVLGDLMDLYGAKIAQAVEEADEERSKQMIFNTLKEENK